LEKQKIIGHPWLLTGNPLLANFSSLYWRRRRFPPFFPKK
jgi:hypothetical protein